MIKNLLAALAVTVMGAVSASAATLTFELQSNFAAVDNGFMLTDTSTSTTIAYVPIGSMINGPSGSTYNQYSYELGAGEYAFTIYEDFGDGVPFYELALDGDLLDSCNNCDFGYSTTISFDVAAVPLPASALLLIGGLAGLGLMRRRKS